MTPFDADKCSLRKRIAAKRDAVEAFPIRLYRTEELPQAFAAMPKLPKGAADAMERIRRNQPEGATPLEEADVFMHVLEAANTNFIPDRWMFLDPTTLRNCAADAERGLAFMNSHRTGGLSTPAELPFGWTFAGQYDEQEQRTLEGIYMLAHHNGEPVRPNGDAGPSTAELHAMINAGTVRDVSVGLYGGKAICDVCGEDLEAYRIGADGWMEYACPHVPGTDQKMGPSEIKQQKKRGVPEGCASYSLVGARQGEVSAVYDGAVPGAGFRKALSLSRDLSDNARTQARAAYCTLARAQDFDVIPPAGVTFEEQVDSVLAAVVSCIERAEGIAAKRAEDGRTLSEDRLRQLHEVADRLGRLLEGCRKAPKLTQAINALRLRAEVINLLAGETP